MLSSHWFQTINLHPYVVGTCWNLFVLLVHLGNVASSEFTKWRPGSEEAWESATVRAVQVDISLTPPC